MRLSKSLAHHSTTQLTRNTTQPTEIVFTLSSLSLVAVPRKRARSTGPDTLCFCALIVFHRRQHFGSFKFSSHPKPQQHRLTLLQSTKTTILHHLHREVADSADSNKNMTFAVHPTRSNLLSSSLVSGCRHVVALFVMSISQTSSLVSRCYPRCLLQHIILRTSKSRFFQLSQLRDKHLRNHSVLAHY